MLEEARALREKLQEEKHGASPTEKTATTPAEAEAPESLSAADAALRSAVAARSLEGLMEAIHGNADGATPEVLDEARALRDELKEEKARGIMTTNQQVAIAPGGEPGDCDGLACDGEPAFGEEGFPDHGEPGVTDCWMACEEAAGPCTFCGRPGEWAGSCRKVGPALPPRPSRPLPPPPPNPNPGPSPRTQAQPYP